MREIIFSNLIKLIKKSDNFKLYNDNLKERNLTY